MLCWPAHSVMIPDFSGNSNAEIIFQRHSKLGGHHAKQGIEDQTPIKRLQDCLKFIKTILKKL